ncbi:hypothetical protein J2Z76_000311 [Sedimentibacter acidaminivorans]|uniref:Pesticidal crystal protein Cry22Aa Ig-like domain-containing protein n=1 Tax=Sedimentibacter acidaminivorans TaxID=913099 RepID=A0ABS4G9T8_9FIRM|nr:immunoglobulin-like domain-containing protein [Sedimentibacter acidaminivorans]MBP1924458.1 hypothetical protein [Sedimentibacter acidaminivorans]
MFKRVISLFIVVMMVIAMIPMNQAYAAPKVKSMKRVSMSKVPSLHLMHAGFNFSSYSQMPDSKGPVYDNPTNEDFNTGTWKKDTIDGKGVAWPGQRDRATMGFCVSLEDHKLLGAALKGQLKAYANAYYDNYKGDKDYGAPFIAKYNRNGGFLGRSNGDNHDVSNWINNNMTISVPTNTAYLIFGVRGKRSGGFLNKDLDMNVNNIYGMIKDTTPPDIVRLENGSPHMSAETEKLKQNRAALEPNVYITMSEDISSFSNMVVTLTANDGSTYNVGLQYLDKDSFNYSNGDVKYKFRIMTENISVQKHFEKVTLYSISAKDTIGNTTTNTKNISCNKRVDTKAPVINIGNTPNIFNVDDYFGLSKVTKTISSNNINNAPVSVTETGTDIAVVNAVKNSNFTIENTTPNTGMFKVTIDAWDLVNNYTKKEQNLFMISNKQPIQFTLENSNNPMFNIIPSDVSSNTKNALTNMYLKTDIDPKYLSGATIYYKWSNIYDESILTNNPNSSWSQVSFEVNKNITSQITIPVEMKSEGVVNYLGPKYNEGYLYIIPKIDDDTTASAMLRASSMAFAETGSDTSGKFNLVDSKPAIGQFINRGCECTGQSYTGDTAEEHYGAIRSHTMDIGFGISENNESLNSIKYFISPRSNTNSYISSGTINKNSDGQYNIPINSISNKTGNYVVTVALYSKMGDITVQKINVNIESPVIGISNIMYNQTTQNLDFTVTYNKNTLFDESFEDINIELTDKDFTEFEDVETGSDKISVYAIPEINGIIPKENWEDSIGDNTFIRTEFTQDANDLNLMRAEFRASLSNMEKSGDAFIKKAGAKRVHLRYTTSNNVQSFHNNIAVINKSNIPPSVSLTGGEQGSYLTSTEYNLAVDSAVAIKITEPIVNLDKAYYDWVESASTSLVQVDDSISGTEILDSDGDGTIELIPKDIPQVTGEILYKAYYLAVYAKNTAGKFIEKAYGPFYVLNENINDKRFNITATDKALDEKQVLIAIDDKLHMIDKLQKPDKLRVVWQNTEDMQHSVVKTYDLSFEDRVNEGETTNLAVINIPYVSLVDTDGIGGTIQLKNIEIYNSEDNTNVYKTLLPDNIKNTLPKHFVTINGLNVKSDEDSISYQWSRNPYAIPVSWVTTHGAITGIDFVPEQKSSIINNSIYFFAKAWNNVYRSDKIELIKPDTLKTVAVKDIKIGEAVSGYYGLQNGSKENTLIRISVNDASEIDEILKVECYDQLSVTSSTAINVSKMFKISEDEIVGFIPSLVTSGGAIRCNVSINGFDSGKTIISSNIGEISSELEEKLDVVKENRVVILENSSEYTNYTLYQREGKLFNFDELGKTEIYENGDYLLVYKNNSNLFAKIINVSGIEYSLSDIITTLSPEKPVEGKVLEPVTATIAMPLGSVIKDKYGVIDNVSNVNDEVIASFTTTRSAIYSFNVKFANDEDLDYIVDLSYIGENYTPILTTVTSSSAITYTPMGPKLTNDNVVVLLSDINVLNNNNENSYSFDKNGNYSFVEKDAEGNLIEYKTSVDWIDKVCPEPVAKKYVWYDFNSDGKISPDEKGSEIPKGYKTKHDVIVEIEFPHANETDRPVKLEDTTNFTVEELSSTEGFAYKYVMAYKPTVTGDATPVFREKLVFTDTLANSFVYNLVINEIDRTDLLTKLNYSTTNYTNRDVVVSMSANRPIKRFDNINVTDENGNVTTVEKDASPTYVFKENGTKDFNYRQIEVVPGEEESGKLTANVTWIDKSVPSVKTEYSNKATNSSVEIKFTVLDGVAEGARLKYNSQSISLTDKGTDKIGTYTVNQNGTYMFEVSNKYGNIGDVVVPINSIDKEEPILNITGRSNVYLRVNDKYYDKGATALDNKDGDITKGITAASNVNTSIPTNNVPYEVTYTVTDASGNTSSKTRYVNVLDTESAVVIVQDNVIDLKSQVTNDILLLDTGVVFVEFVGIDGNYTVKYARGENYDNAYFKTNGSYMSKLGTFTVQEGVYTLYVQDQERNTRMITLNFVK